MLFSLPYISLNSYGDVFTGQEQLSGQPKKKMIKIIVRF